jgi:23S rRNA (pseudouridine1915-N3)-methyltransferase
MKVALLWVGKTNEAYLKEGMTIYAKRLKHYVSTEVIEIKDIKKFSDQDDLKDKEGKEILNKLKPEDFVVLLDEKGKSLTSVGFSKLLSKHQVNGTRRMVFIIGGAFGFSVELYDRADQLLSLSAMTFSHQMIRLFFYEQIYRAFTIIRNEKYHNE